MTILSIVWPIHFLKKYFFLITRVRFRCIHNKITHVALVHSAVLRKRNCAILGEWFPGVRYLEVKMYDGAPFGAKILSAVRNREASASRRLLMYYSYGIFNP